MTPEVGGPKDGAKRKPEGRAQVAARQAKLTAARKAAGLIKWQRWVTRCEAEALDAMLGKMRGVG